MDFRVTFWGVRGSTACPEPAFARYGGHTSCIGLEIGGRHVILDAGTGLRGPDSVLPVDADVDLLLTHCHFDHICGLPEFKKLFSPDFSCHVRAGHLPVGESIESVMRDFISPPHFPFELDKYPAAISFTDFVAGDSFTLGGDINVRTIPLNHTDGATGYRIDVGHKSRCIGVMAHQLAVFKVYRVHCANGFCRRRQFI